MLLIATALIAQTIALDTDGAKAARTCAQVVTLADAGTRSQMQLSSQFTYLIMQSVKAKREGNFFEQVNTLSENASTGAMTIEQAKSLVAACDARFPIARSSAPTRLPADAFRRDVLCFGMLSVLQGVAEEIAKTGSDADLIKIRAALEPLTDKITDEELNKRGLGTDDKFVTLLGDEMLGSLSTGNPLTIAAACGVTI